MSLLLFFAGAAVSAEHKPRGAFYPTQEELRELLGRRQEDERRSKELQERIDETIEQAYEALFGVPAPVEIPPEDKTPQPEIPAPVTIIGPALSRRALRLLTRTPKPPEESEDDRDYRLFVASVEAQPDMSEYIAHVEQAIQKLLDDDLTDKEAEKQLAQLDETMKALAESKEYRRIKRYLDS